MVPFVLLPLYIYPLPGLWDPLFQAAKSYPSVNFLAVINPDNGPGDGDCPNSDYANATSYLNSIPNIQTLAYIHTAARWDCGPTGTWICPCSQPLDVLEANITKYQNWNVPDHCVAGTDVHIDGIFFDESPSDANCSTYMSNATAFAKSTLTRSGTVLFNTGQAVDSTYWSIADYINVFEDTEAAYDTADIGALDGEGAYHAQTTMIIHNYADGPSIVRRDVDTILSFQKDAMAGLYITDLDIYSAFPTNFTGFVSEVAAVIGANAATAN